MTCAQCHGWGRRVDYTRELGEGCTVPCDHATGSGMPVDPEDERWLALDAECDRLREMVRKYARHLPDCLVGQMVAFGEGREPACRCGFSAEWRRVFGHNR